MLGRIDITQPPLEAGLKLDRAYIKTTLKKSKQRK